ncbi:UPF0183-domain-containing protein [Vararia minispora EC-137]|uniref:UPF0183-domain-containing protein n=1 Tax=Vararia minispora EC-137 TaxID=1314806 RepID=A0ACB8QFU0_9AGAM|nr:UPF0183-domain-containing protein [Vararia minispora EC-137]
MYSDLDLDLRPGDGVGNFVLGASLWTVIEFLRSNTALFPQVELKYDPDASATPIIIHVRPHIDLLFSPAHQRLHTIALRNFHDHPPLTLRYKDKVLASPDSDLKRVDVNLAFGPTYPGDDLIYPGVRFFFSDDVSKAPNNRQDRTQNVKRILVSQSDADPNVSPRDPLGEVQVCAAMDDELAEAVARVHDGVTLRFYPDVKQIVRVRLGVTTAQDLLCDLGPPLRTFYKEDDRMSIHSRTRSADEEGVEPSYFYNYLHHGLDFLIADGTHVVKKIIMHTNVPGSPLFQRYKRCPWQIEGSPEDDEDDSPPRVRFHDRVDVISRFLSPGGAPPSMNFDRTVGEDTLTLPTPITRLLGFDGVILEATQAAQVVSVTLF